ncbi:Kunitz/Bovine pancreatic trypsin inhibitor domain protein, partial [Dictyocaulus viviparus]
IAGNENNFLIREHCESACPIWTNVCPEGEALLLPSGIPQPCNPSNEDSCPQTHWCHAGMKKFPNNFLVKKICEARCRVQSDPCPLTMNSFMSPVAFQTCSTSLQCPKNQWCHIGETEQTTVCCPNAVPDPCMSPARNPGEGSYRATRWTFDSLTRKCVPFEYKGMRGNANNFLTRENCEQRCPVFKNPCKLFEPFSMDGKYYECSPTDLCPNKYFCHIGLDANYCCPVMGNDPCSQPLDNGIGVAELQRWFWNAQFQTCLPFSYRGMKGTQNNFLSKQDCEQTCYVLVNPCALGKPQMTIDNHPQTCSITQNTCTESFWCHYGANQQTTVCCPGKVNGLRICQQPLALGNGDSTLTRWYYDTVSMRCTQFYYRGLYGNQNNFHSQKECERTCPVIVNVCPVGTPLFDSTHRPVPCTFGSDTCGQGYWCHLGLVPDEYQCCPGVPTIPGACKGLPIVVGKLGASLPPTTRYYYDQHDMTCKQFVYNGRKGNQNNFLTLEDCRKTCPVFNNPCNRPIPLPPKTCSAIGPDVCGPNSWCHIGGTADTTLCCPSEGDPCLLPLNRGTGNQYMNRWYFNQQTGTCLQFMYAGLHGNQNNFLTKEVCEERCGPNPCFEGRPLVGFDGKPQICSVSSNFNTCPTNYWCHIGADTSSTVCCPGG